MPHLFVDQLTNIDCSVLDTERGLIGASWMVDVELQGELDQQSMVFDFSEVKKTIKRIIDEQVDHKLVVPGQFSGLVKREHDDQLEIEFADNTGQHIYHRSPLDAVCELPAAQVTTTAITDYLRAKLVVELPDNVDKLTIHLREESATGNYYCYSHGLKKHGGNCQRIAHGHRSQIQIWQNGKRSDELEKDWAERWRDIYIGTTEDVTKQEHGQTCFAYASEQGEFELHLAEQRVHLMSADSTVECIAEHIYKSLLAEHPNTEIKVKAFEGINKGAMAS